MWTAFIAPDDKLHRPPNNTAKYNGSLTLIEIGASENDLQRWNGNVAVNVIQRFE